MARKALSKSLKTESEQGQETKDVKPGIRPQFSLVAWGRPRHFISPEGPFSRSLFFKLVREGAFLTKNVKVGDGDRIIKLVNIASVDAYLNGLPTRTQKRPPHQLVRKHRSTSRTPGLKPGA